MNKRVFIRLSAAIAIGLALAACSSPPPTVQLPPNVTVDSNEVTASWDTVLVAINILRDHVGEGFFEANQFHFSHATWSKNGCSFWCRIRFSYLKDTETYVQYTLRPDGTVRGLRRFPRCDDEDFPCYIKIDRATALQIVRERGVELQDGHSARLDWRRGFRWLVDTGPTNHEPPYEQRHLAIDAVTGDVLEDMITAVRPGGPTVKRP